MSFRILAKSGVFPPRRVLNAFFACGYDDLDDEVLNWQPFQLTEEEYDRFFEWWRTLYSNSHVEDLGVYSADFSTWFTRAVEAGAS